ncbi:hypothetical protein TNCV_2198261 [Trichonephila clavipes]|nr:hypothetical protein TNCV_2198261 [Trichonephila clavipes]
MRSKIESQETEKGGKGIHTIPAFGATITGNSSGTRLLEVPLGDFLFLPEPLQPSPPIHTQIHARLLVDSLSCPLLRFSIGPETSAELQHSKIYGFSELFGSAGNLLTHPTIYGSSEPQSRELSGTPLPKEFHSNSKKLTWEFRGLLNSFWPPITCQNCEMKHQSLFHFAKAAEN